MCLYYSNPVFTHTDRGGEDYRNPVKLKLEESSFCLFVCFEWKLLCRNPHREHCLPGKEWAAVSPGWMKCHHHLLQSAALKSARHSVTATLRPTGFLSFLFYFILGGGESGEKTMNMGITKPSNSEQSRKPPSLGTLLVRNGWFIT